MVVGIELARAMEPLLTSFQMKAFNAQSAIRYKSDTQLNTQTYCEKTRCILFSFFPSFTFFLSIFIFHSTDHQRKQCAHSKICFENNFNLPRGSKMLWIHSDEKWMKMHVRSVCVCGAVLFDACAFIYFLSKG